MLNWEKMMKMLSFTAPSNYGFTLISAAKKPQIFNQVLDEIDYTLLKLCNGKLSKKEVLRQGRMKLDPLGKNPDFYNQAQQALNKMEGYKWILYRKP
ncbi:hypothetical protein [Acetobacterium wieringae]|uniref:hypothetical protein n=1 Tax=Acetobacterium wieringae TaxID=52694 RepID=UPI0020338EC8|nr:hypothetical protein [Acetobacterium wieringae]URN86254.1 hypothetical protein CHL1_003379 [Acetobacterium wieringae]